MEETKTENAETEQANATPSAETAQNSDKTQEKAENKAETTTINKEAAETDKNGSKTILGDTPENKGAGGDNASKPEPLKADSIKYPEGYTAAPAEAEEYISLANELGLTAEQAQKILDYSLSAKDSVIKSATQKAEAEFAAKKEEWRKATEEKFAANYDATISTTRKAYNRYATAEFRKLMDISGLGNHPAVIETFYNIGKATTDDKFAESTPSAEPKKKKKFADYY